MSGGKNRDFAFYLYVIYVYRYSPYTAPCLFRLVKLWMMHTMRVVVVRRCANRAGTAGFRGRDRLGLVEVAHNRTVLRARVQLAMGKFFHNVGELTATTLLAAPLSHASSS